MGKKMIERGELEDLIAASVEERRDLNHENWKIRTEVAEAIWEQYAGYFRIPTVFDSLEDVKDFVRQFCPDGCGMDDGGGP